MDTITADQRLDILDEIDAAAAISLTTPGEVRQAWLDAIADLTRDAPHEFHSGQVRRMVPAWAHGPESGALITGLVRTRQIRATNRRAALGNVAQRAGDRRVKVYRLTPLGLAQIHGVAA